MKKYLVVGSAPYVKDWWNNNGNILKKNDFYVCAMNNAWSITGVDTDYWYFSNDFFCTGHVLPTVENFQKELRCIRGGIFSNFLHNPYWYKCEFGSGTMILNVLYDIVNRSIIQEEDAIIVVIGCDLIYNKEQNHFYGKGTADPLRMGEEWLDRELKVLDELVRKRKKSLGYDTVVILNASKGESRLPFERIDDVSTI